MINETDLFFINKAMSISEKSTCKRRHVGCIIVTNEDIVGSGTNNSVGNIACKNCYRMENNIPSGKSLDKCYAIHAEQNAIMDALKSNKKINNCTVYVTTFPCSTCMKLLASIGCSKIIYLSDYDSEFSKVIAMEHNITLIKIEKNKEGEIYND